MTFTIQRFKEHLMYNFRFIILLLSTFLFSVSHAQEELKTGTISLSTTEINYGTIKKEAEGTRELLITNKGIYPLIINSCKATCGCTVPICPIEPIMPGKTEVVKIKYNTHNVGSFSKNITVYSNDQNNPVSIVRIYGEVVE